MTEKAQIRAGVIATVLGGLILLAIVWFLGILKPVFVAIARAALWALHGMTASVTLPVWLLVILGAAVCVALLRNRSGRRWTIPKDGPPITLDVAPTKPLDQNEMSVLRFLAQGEGGLVSVEQLAIGLGLKKLLVEQALDRLWNRGHLDDNYNYLRGRRYRLSSHGREVAIKADLVK